MSVEHSDHEVIGGAQRSVQQLVFTAAQLVEVITRMRAAADQRRETDARAAAASDRGTADRLRARQDSDRRTEHAARAGARQQWTPANNRQWRHDATPEDLLTAWAAATTWAGSDQHAAAAMLRAEDEIRDRWPNVTDRYDRLRVDDGLHPAAAMTIALADAANAGWDPITNPAATARPRAPTRAMLGPAATRLDDLTTTVVKHDVGFASAVVLSERRDDIQRQADTAAGLALRWHSPVGRSPVVQSTETSPRIVPASTPRRAR